LEHQVKNTHNSRVKCAVITTLYKTDDPDLWVKALRSVLGEAGPDLDVAVHLCVDGPIPEKLEAVLRENSADIRKIVRNDVNRGLAVSLNRLIETMDDVDYVFRMDADDISLPGRFRAQIRWLEEHPLAWLVGCQATDIDDDGTPLGDRDFPCHPKDAKNLLVKQNPVLHPTFCMRRELLADPDIRYPEAHLTEDLAFLVRMAEKGYVFGNSPERLFQWRTGSAFFRRRSSLKRGWTEFIWYARAVRAVKGPFSPHMVFPVARLLLRCLPPGTMKALYRSGLRGGNLKKAGS
jgi:GT2 family glycosyltransferase